MNVAQLLQLFLFTQNHKIVKPLLPNVIIVRGFPQTCLVGQVPCPELAQHLAREPLFEHLNDSRNSATGRFADEKMNVLGHKHVSHHDKLVATSDLLKDFQEPVAPARFAEDRLAMIAATRDEVEVPGVIFSS